MTIQKCLFDALLSKCDADVKDSLARLHIYFNNSVGIGEHPQITEEMTKMLDDLSSAEDRKNALLNHFSHLNKPQKSKCPNKSDSVENEVVTNKKANCCC